MALRGKKLTVLGAGYLQRPLIRRARELGVRTICFAWENGAVCRDEADRFYPVSIREKETIAAICRDEKIDGITTIASDAAVPTMTFVADALALPGNSPASGQRTTHKGIMREILASAGLPCPPFRRVRTAGDIHAAAAELGFPLVVKPCDRSGSLGVCRVTDLPELLAASETAINCSFTREAVIEKAIDIAREFSVEGISWQGEYHLLAFTDKETSGPPHYVEIGHRQPSTLPETVRHETAQFLTRALPALGITCGASHAEWMLSADGQLFVTEIAARMGGDFIGSDLVPLSTGYDFLRGVMETALGEFSGVSFTRSRSAGIRFWTPVTPEVKTWLETTPRPDWIVTGELHPDSLKPLTCSGDRAGYLICCGREE